MWRYGYSWVGCVTTIFLVGIMGRGLTGSEEREMSKNGLVCHVFLLFTNWSLQTLRTHVVCCGWVGAVVRTDMHVWFDTRKKTIGQKKKQCVATLWRQIALQAYESCYTSRDKLWKASFIDGNIVSPLFGSRLILPYQERVGSIQGPGGKFDSFLCLWQLPTLPSAKEVSALLRVVSFNY